MYTDIVATLLATLGHQFNGQAVVLLRLAARKGYLPAYLPCWHVFSQSMPVSNKVWRWDRLDCTAFIFWRCQSLMWIQPNPFFYSVFMRNKLGPKDLQILVRFEPSKNPAIVWWSRLLAEHAQSSHDDTLLIETLCVRRAGFGSWWRMFRMVQWCLNML